MATNEFTEKSDLIPSFLNTFFKPWNTWPHNSFEKTLLVPAVNITENGKEFKISVAAPGMNKTDFKIDVEGDVLTISAEKEEKDEKYNRKEYNYSSFSRSFTMPGEVMKDKIEARYEDGVLQLMLPKKESTRLPVKTVTVS